MQTRHARGDYRQVLRLHRLLREGEQRPADMAEALGCDRRTVERMLRVFEAEGEPVQVRREGRAAWYSLDMRRLTP